MTFKEIIKKKVPDYVQGTPEFRVFLALVKKEDIRGPASLRKYLDINIENLKAEMKEKGKSNPSGTMRRHIKRLGDRLSFLKLVNKKIIKYL